MTFDPFMPLDTTDIGDELDDILGPGPVGGPAPTVAVIPSGPLKTQLGTDASRVGFFDIETIPDYSRLDSFRLPDLPPKFEVIPCELINMTTTPKEFLAVYTTVQEIATGLYQVRPDAEWCGLLECEEQLRAKPRKGVSDEIDKYISQFTNHEQAVEARRKLLSVTPEYCRIASIAWAMGNGKVFSKVVDHKMDSRVATLEDEISEVELLNLFWDFMLEVRPVCGYNILSFDLPVVYIRSLILGVAPSRHVPLSPYGEDVCDLFVKRFGKSKPPNAPGKMKDICRLYGIGVPAGDTDGSQAEDLYMSNPQKLREYNESDVECSRNLFVRMSGFFFS